MPTQEDWSNAGFVQASKHRVAVLEELDGGPGTPTNLAEELEVDISHVSRALISLKDEGLAQLLVPEDRQKGRIYGVTEEGGEALELARTL